MRPIIVLILVLILISSTSFAAEREVVCARYKKNYGWSALDRVEVTIMKGSELNKITHSLAYIIYQPMSLFYEIKIKQV